MGKYHPHGDQAIYDALVRMAQDFSMRAAADRRAGQFRLDRRRSAGGDALHRSAARRRSRTALLDDIDKDTVDFQAELRRLERGADGPAGAVPEPARQRRRRHRRRHGDQHPAAQSRRSDRRRVALIDDPAITIDELMEIVPGPDFPTGGIILGRAGIRAAYRHRPRLDHHARPRRMSRRSARTAKRSSSPRFPYQVNKATMIEKIAELVRDKRIEGISDIRDESDRDGMRVVIELKRDAMADVVLNQLYRFTPLQTSSAPTWWR